MLRDDFRCEVQVLLIDNLRRRDWTVLRSKFFGSRSSLERSKTTRRDRDLAGTKNIETNC